VPEEAPSYSAGIMTASIAVWVCGLLDGVSRLNVGASVFAEVTLHTSRGPS